MWQRLKRSLYFPIAAYFRFWAQIRLSRWHPTIIVITGSSGKTTLLHLLESQIGKFAKFSHHANSSYGIPFDILGLHRETLLPIEWPLLFFRAPLQIFAKPYPEQLYVVEADCDRPGEGQFIASLLKPHYVLWLNATKTHSMNFDQLIVDNKFKSIEDAVAYEFGFFIEHAKTYVLVNGDQQVVKDQFPRTNAAIESITKNTYLQNYLVTKDATEFKIQDQTYRFPYLLPADVFYAVTMCLIILQKLHIKPDKNFSNFTLPPGRNSLFKGIKNTTIIDSSYNANLSSMSTILNMMKQLDVDNKWLILGDMLEQGNVEKEEHEKLAQVISDINSNHIILLGPRNIKYTYPKLKNLINKTPIFTTDSPREVLSYISTNIEGGETLLFKGGRFLEGVIEHLLANKKDITKLCRREKVWQIRRQKWGL